MKFIRPVIGFCVALFVAGTLISCEKTQPPVKGFVLPEGDIQRGQEVFATIGCRGCHNVAELELPPFDGAQILNITLGGQVHKVKTYGDLLTSIVNPGHTLSPVYLKTLEPKARENAKSPMPNFNEVINVAQLIDLTAFLHSRYELLSPQYQGYLYGP